MPVLAPESHEGYNFITGAVSPFGACQTFGTPHDCSKDLASSKETSTCDQCTLPIGYCCISSAPSPETILLEEQMRCLLEVNMWAE